MTTPAERRPVERVGSDGTRATIDRAIAVEMPIALEFNGIGYAVMMATPADLEDFATGFSLSERLIDRAADIVDIDAHETPQGVLLRVTLIDDRLPRVMERVRHRVSESSCGLCGIENLETALRPLPAVAATSDADEAAIFRALGRLRDHQPLNAETGAVHAAAFCSAQGEVLIAREDVGRHNAFDKLIGAMARDGRSWDGGFALLSSRCSFELVEKAVLADCPLLVTVSAPTSLAVTRAAEAGLRLIVLARPDALLIA
ncbi:formate dehydrogenase accessory sulfurtransferase FdhD [Sphingomonas crocodyli]|uniref:Sulfur carrier protein FdhD n=1 Tax=Sphingomonas crocodyli TaxID=1979270 RepID=A0A437LV33_9SPHN|nr:formate dehydrogenase accessory sulfurtransferase FdhD [Sphingomonas crocodyli]RVT89153.1 formate dehydrogenase accessory sulfurtransferase FdhD [Sphingomonas crocodyli]